MIQYLDVKPTFQIAIIGAALLAAAYGQTPGARGKIEFDAASVRVSEAKGGFHFSTGTGSGGPGTNDPGMFRCSNCTLATLIVKAFDLQPYQFPGRTALADNSFDVVTKIPAGTSPEEFQAMLQNLLKDRFGLAFHFTTKNMRGYTLVLGAKGSKLKESGDDARPASADSYRPGQTGDHNHTGVIAFNGSATFRRDHQTTADLAQLLSDQLSVPVEDQTGLHGKYDIALSWSGDVSHSGNHADGGWGGAGHADHGGGSAAPGGTAGRSGDASGPTLFEAVQSQLGLKLVQSDRAAARVFVVDRVQPLPTEN